MGRLLAERGARWAWVMCALAIARASGASAQEEEEGLGSEPGAETTAGCFGPPGLYKVDSDCDDDGLTADTRSFKPLYELWSDGAHKERFIYLPPGSTIDATNPDRWVFPQGTRLYKTFAIEKAGVLTRVETRLIEKTGAGVGIEHWTLKAYPWNADQRSVAEPVAAGIEAVDDSSGWLQQGHSIPSEAQCVTCHRMNSNNQNMLVRSGPSFDPILGFSALQLNHAGAEYKLSELLPRLTNAGSIDLGTASFGANSIEANARGYLHANCGNCHGNAVSWPGLKLWHPLDPNQRARTLDATGVCKPPLIWPVSRSTPNAPAFPFIIAPQDPGASSLLERMTIRDPRPVPGIGQTDQMPPLATHIVDPTGVNHVTEWVNMLPPCP